MEQGIQDTVKELKKSLRLSMNGVVSTLQRRQGLNYKINFGVEVPAIKNIASHYNKNRELASALWNENIRECKMLAIFLMPENEFTANDAESWIASTPYTEIADQLAMNLLSKLPDAEFHAVRWIEEDDEIYRYCGFMTLSHIFRTGKRLSDECDKQYIANAAKILSNEHESNKVLQNCVYTSLLKYISCDENGNKTKILQDATLQHFFT